MRGRVPHHFVVQHMAGHAVGEGRHDRRGLEAMAPYRALRRPSHVADVLGDDPGRRFYRSSQSHTEAVEDHRLGDLHDVRG